MLYTIERDTIDTLFKALQNLGFSVIGPTVRDQTIVYDALQSSADLPVGWTDDQDGGSYRLTRRNDDALFGYVVGPHSWKTFLFPPRTRLWSAKRTADGFDLADTDSPPPTKFAFIGVRACELSAIAIQDRVFSGGDYIDPVYSARRKGAFIVAVNCGQAGGTCFCVSMQTGPRASAGFDLALTEILRDGRHYFLLEVGSMRGKQVLDEIPYEEAKDEDNAAAEAVWERAASQMGRSLDTSDIKDLLCNNYEHPRWDKVAKRCLSCGNCTLVCPTCFCSTVEDTTDLTGTAAERWRRWDSCFTMDFSYIHGGNVRKSTKSRYRQWMTHKLATWIDQFGTSGCVGCGRCITWCPVGIDLTEESRAIRESKRSTAAAREQITTVSERE
jgi:ferredoxin